MRSTLQECRVNRAGAWTSRQPDNVRALPRAGEAEGCGAVLEHPASGKHETRPARGTMKKKGGRKLAKEKRKKGAGRKKGSGGKTFIKARPAMPFTDKRAILFHGQLDWRMICLRRILDVIAKNDGKLPDNYLSARAVTIMKNALPFRSPMDELWGELAAEFERAVLRGDADWFRAQANVIEGKRKARYTPRGIFEWEVTPILLQAEYLNAKGYRVTAGYIYNGLRKKECPTDQQPHGVKVEGCYFENRERCMDAIRELAENLKMPLPKEQGKRPKKKPSQPLSTDFYHGRSNRARGERRAAIEKLKKFVSTEKRDSLHGSVLF
jgi:hypothetical protein